MYNLQLEWIRWIQQIRTPWLDHFFKFLNLLDSATWIGIWVILVLLCYNWKAGIKFFYVVIINAILNGFLKDLFQAPRPFQLDSSLGVIQVGQFGFPSGAAQMSFLMGGLLIAYWKNRFKWVFGISYILLMSFSRIYLGVHFFSDVIGGWIAGFLVLYTFIKFLRPVEQKLKSLSFNGLLFFSIIIPVMFMAFRSAIVKADAAAAIGVGLGSVISYKYRIFLTPAKKILDFVFRMCIGLIPIFLLDKAVFLLSVSVDYKILFNFLIYGIWVGIGAVLTYKITCKLFIKLKLFFK